MEPPDVSCAYEIREGKDLNSGHSNTRSFLSIFLKLLLDIIPH